ncbi:MAG TPA: TfoX/Sxy family protein [Actinomycetota bacterium]|nr:TfoX/Sxy family protein [Actinomycetota bacterium]
MPNTQGFVDFVVEQLDGLGDVTVRPMFGGHGFYLGRAFFAIVYDDRVYLKTGDATRGWYEEQGMGTFRPHERQDIKSYHEVPPDAVEDREKLADLAAAAVRIAEAGA